MARKEDEINADNLPPLEDDPNATTVSDTGEKKTRKRRSDAGSGQRSTRGKKGEITLTEADTKTSFYWLFILLSMIFRSDAAFVEEEFKNLARAYVTLANKLPILKTIMLAMAPIATFGEMVKFMKRIKDNRRPKPKKETPASQMTFDIEHTA